MALRKAVSKNKRRYQADGFDLDLSFITDRIIAMGFPADRWEGIYRNPIDEVVRFMETKFKDRYKVYNLKARFIDYLKPYLYSERGWVVWRCDNRSYDTSKFHHRVACYPFTDHQPPNLELLLPFCQDVHDWLAADEENVVAIHCKAGKGRTGVMICAYLLFEGICRVPQEALKFYGSKRTLDMNGVTIPSQRRYVEYFGHMLSSKVAYFPVPMLLKSLHFECTPNLDKLLNCYPCFSVYSNGAKIYKSPTAWEIGRGAKNLSMSLPERVSIAEDVRIDFYNRPPFRKKEKLFHFWFNTFFLCPSSCTAGAKVKVPHGGVGPVSGSGRRRVSRDENGEEKRRPRPALPPFSLGPAIHSLTIPKDQLDRANKLKLFPPEFKVHIFLECLSGQSGNGDGVAGPSEPSASQEEKRMPSPKHSAPGAPSSNRERRGSGGALERVKSYSGNGRKDSTSAGLLIAPTVSNRHRKSADYGLDAGVGSGEGGGEEEGLGPRIQWSESDEEEEEEEEEEESEEEPDRSQDPS